MLTTCVVGEMVSHLPIAGGHITLAKRFVDPALSLTMGWNYWCAASSPYLLPCPDPPSSLGTTGLYGVVAAPTRI